MISQKFVQTYQSFKNIINTVLSNKQQKYIIFAAGGVGCIGLIANKIITNRKISNCTQSEKALLELIYKKFEEYQFKIPLINIEKIDVDQEGCKFICYLQENLQQKCQATQVQKKDPFLPPYENGQFICEITKTHNIMINKYCISKFHLLVVTKDFQEQESILTLQDFIASLQVMHTLDGFCFYNAGYNAGASQKHRHIQILPDFSSSFGIEYPLGEQIDKLSQEHIKNNKQTFVFEKFNFQHIIITLKQLNEFNNSYSQYGKYIYSQFIKYYQQFKTNKSQFLSYNIIINKHFLLIVPRSQAQSHGLAINALSYLGTFFNYTKGEFDIVKEVGPLNILKDASYEVLQKTI